MHWSGPWAVVARSLGASERLAGSACGKRQRGLPLNAIVSHHLESGRVGSIASSSTALEYPVATVGDNLPALNRLRCSVCVASSSPSRGLRRKSKCDAPSSHPCSGPVHTAVGACQTFGIVVPGKENDG